MLKLKHKLPSFATIALVLMTAGILAAIVEKQIAPTYGIKVFIAVLVSMVIYIILKGEIAK